MDRKRKETNLLTKTAELFDLPADVVAGAPRIELLGARELFADNHTGILTYGESLIDINTSGLIVRVRGEGLELRAMTDRDLRIAGRIDAVEFVR
ncbi:MAG: YabP/YqfC family sporulation protein [Oscillospiraceae bacterium]|nr:YabP/YqfC family sporulation protein [Oscillospiraceae bacterium]